jgi:F1F0 ATPase subunit 2
MGPNEFERSIIMTGLSWHLILAFMAGTGIGAFYFGGLWWTVRRLPTEAHPARLTLLSLLVRTALSMGAFYVVMGGEWERLLAALLGAMTIRFVMVRRLRPE